MKTRVAPVWTVALPFAFALVIALGAPNPAWGICLSPSSDTNGNGQTNVVDLQCGILYSLWQLAEGVDPEPTCSLIGLQAIDVNCDGTATVSDLQLIIYDVLNSQWSSVVDSDGDQCVDTCQTGNYCYEELLSESFDGYESTFEMDNLDAVVGWRLLSTGQSVSAPGALYYGNPETMNFDSDSPNYGTATSPTFYLPNVAGITVSFSAFVDTELSGTYDQLKLYVDNGSQLTQIWDKSEYTAGDLAVWNSFEVGLDNYADQLVSFVFEFNSVDAIGNSGEGVYIDDFLVGTNCPGPCNADADCADADACTTELCDLVAGICAVVPTDCDDGSACTVNTCDQEKGCEAVDVDCDDGEICTDDTCDPTDGCASTTADCDDGDTCTLDTCDVFSGCESATIACDDQDLCTADTCVDAECVFTTVEGCCYNDLLNETFEDGDGGFVFDGTSALSLWQTYDGGQSASGSAALYYGNTADIDFDDGQTEGTATSPAIALPNTVGLELSMWAYLDTESYNAYDQLEVIVDTGEETSTVWSKNDYDTSTMATWQYQLISLDAFAGQTVTLIFSFNTMDGVGNTGEGVYIDDVRIQAPCAVECTSDEDCDDGDPCTISTCGAESICESTAILCDDGDACTDDLCETGVGCAATAIECNDTNDCTTDSCDPSSGCVFAEDVCDDGDQCTSDECDSVFGDGCSYAVVNCNDSDDCTADTCEPGSGCVFEPFDTPECCYEPVTLETFDGDDPGFTFDNQNDDSKWQIYGGGKSHTAPNALYYGSVASMTYDTGASAGTVSSSSIALPASLGVKLSFWVYMDTEGCCDTLTLSIDNAVDPPTESWSKTNYLAVGPMGTWQKHVVNLDAFAGQTIQVQFTFDADGSVNNFEGVYIDDIQVSAPCPEACETDTDCDDGDPCTLTECTPDGTCASTLETCDDGNACTTDLCSPALGCSWGTVICPAGDSCVNNVCNPEVGCEGIPIDCGDGDPCTVDSCLPFEGCSSTPLVCMDGDLCTTDACVDGECVYEGIDACCYEDTFLDGFEADVGDWSFDGTSDFSEWQFIEGGQTTLGNGALYYGNNKKMNFDDGETSGTATSATISLPNNVGIEFSMWVFMDTELGLSYDQLEVLVDNGDVAVSVWSKSDYVVANMGTWQYQQISLDAFAGQEVKLVFSFDSVDATANAGEGVYIDDVHVQAPCAIACSADEGCDDGNPCTTGACSALGDCVQSVETCDDDDACTVNECTDWIGCDFKVLSCDDSDECTSDTCDPDLGCVFANDACDDGDPCTADACDSLWGLECTYTPDGCNDGDTCTLDTCDPELGCQNVADDALCCFGPAIYSESFDGGDSGFTFENSDNASHWQITESGKSYSAPGALYYGSLESMNYDTGSSTGTAKSPAFVVPAAGGFTLSFWVYIDAEASSLYDPVAVAIAPEGSESIQMWNKDDYKASGPLATWHHHLVDLDAFAGQTVHIEFSFSPDNSVNYFEGVYFDNIEVLPACGPITPPVSPVGETCADAIDLGDGGTIAIDLCEYTQDYNYGWCGMQGPEAFIKTNVNYETGKLEMELLQSFSSLVVNFRYNTEQTCEEESELFCYYDAPATASWAGYNPEDSVYVSLGSTDGSCGVVEFSLTTTTVPPPAP